MNESRPDLIDSLAGIAAGSAWHALRERREATRRHSELAYRALFHPATAGPAGLAERYAIATYVAGLHGEAEPQAHYAAVLAAIAPSSLAGAVTDAVRETLTSGPYGAFPAGPLPAGDADGAAFVLSPAVGSVLGRRLVAAFAHAHLLVFHPRDARPGSLHALRDAGWNADGIVTLAQIVGFLAYQIRVAAGLRTLAAQGGTVAS